MVYFDYAANTPVNENVLKRFVDTNMFFSGNANAKHMCGKKAYMEIENATNEIRTVLGIKDMEVIYTSGASESNNLAITGVARAYRGCGKHIISTYLEHSSVGGTLTHLQSLGYEVDLVQITKSGTVDVEHLKELIRPDTILVSIGWVDSELGTKQPIEEISNIVRQYPDCIFHVDATQAVGKMELDFSLADLIAFAPHKFYGINGMGVLLRKENVVLSPIIHGGKSTSIYRSGTPVTAWATATSEAVSQCIPFIQENVKKVARINEWLRQELRKYPLVHINSGENTLPHFLNFSIRGANGEEIQSLLDQQNIFVSTKAACSVPNTPSKAVMAVTGDKKLARASIRISLSHLVTDEEVDYFLRGFKEVYNILNND